VPEDGNELAFKVGLQQLDNERIGRIARDGTEGLVKRIVPAVRAQEPFVTGGISRSRVSRIVEINPHEFLGSIVPGKESGCRIRPAEMSAEFSACVEGPGLAAAGVEPARALRVVIIRSGVFWFAKNGVNERSGGFSLDVDDLGGGHARRKSTGCGADRAAHVADSKPIRKSLDADQIAKLLVKSVA